MPGRKHSLELPLSEATPLKEILARVGIPLAEVALTAQGIYVMGGTAAQIFQSMLLGPLMSKKGGKTMGGVSAKISQKDLVTLKELIEAGKIVPVIAQRFPLSEAAQALRYLGAGHARGKVVITVIE